MTSKKGDEIARTKALSRAVEIQKYLRAARPLTNSQICVHPHVMAAVQLIVDYLSD